MCTVISCLPHKLPRSSHGNACASRLPQNQLEMLLLKLNLSALMVEAVQMNLSP